MKTTCICSLVDHLKVYHNSIEEETSPFFHANCLKWFLAYPLVTLEWLIDWMEVAQYINIISGAGVSFKGKVLNR